MFTLPTIQKIILQHYGFEASIKKLDGYDDLNFLITKKPSQERFIFKIANDGSDVSVLQAQHHILTHLKPNFSEKIPTPLPSISGKTIISVQNSEGETFSGRMLSFLEGDFMCEVDISVEILKNLGCLLGKINKSLQNIHFSTLTHRNLTWDLKNVLNIEPHLHFIKNPQQQNIARYYLFQFEQIVQPKLKNLRQSIIHGDANDHNILTQNQEISGLIDFGDAVFSHTIFELAIALPYIMMRSENPIEDTLPLISAYHEQLPLQAIELEILYYLIAARLCTTVVMAAKSKAENPDNIYTSIHEKSAWDLLEKWASINPIYAENTFKKACNFPQKLKPDYDKILTKRKQIIGRNLSISYSENPLKIERGAFQYLYDDEGKTYLDCVNNICHVGHCHPKVVKAAQKQMVLLNTNTRYLYDNLLEYAEMLLETFPKPLGVVFFVNSGSEACDLAQRLARAHTGSKETIVMEGAYHGHTTSGIAVSPYKYKGKGGAGKESHIHEISLPDTYRGKYKGENAGEKYANEVKNIVDNLIGNGKRPSAFMCESLLGCGGQIVLPDGFLQKSYEYIRAAGGVCMADEVQVGFGRVGEKFWGFELQNVVPDIVMVGKPIGNGHPMAAVITTPEIANSFNNGMEFFSSFGGNPVSCAVGKTVLEVIKDEKLQENALEVGNFLLKEWKKLQEKHKIIGDVRGKGLFLGMELVRNHQTLEPADAEAENIVIALKERGVLLSTDGPFHNVIKFKPPMVFTKKNAEFLVKVVGEVLGLF